MFRATLACAESHKYWCKKAAASLPRPDRTICRRSGAYSQVITLAHRLDIVPRHRPEPDEAPVMAAAVLDKLRYVLGRDHDNADLNDWFLATAFALRDRIIDRWTQTA